MADENFVMELVVRPRHCDAQAMVHAGRYHDFCEDAFLEWLEFIDAPYSALRSTGVDLVISDARYSYHRPARLDDRLRISVSAKAANESTLVVRFDVRRAQQSLAVAEITYVAVRDGRRGSLPPALGGLKG